MPVWMFTELRVYCGMIWRGALCPASFGERAVWEGVSTWRENNSTEAATRLNGKVKLTAICMCLFSDRVIAAFLAHLTQVLGSCSAVDFDKILHVFHASVPIELSPRSHSALIFLRTGPPLAYMRRWSCRTHLMADDRRMSLIPDIISVNVHLSWQSLSQLDGSCILSVSMLKPLCQGYTITYRDQNQCKYRV